jgi:hypothetical protein
MDKEKAGEEAKMVHQTKIVKVLKTKMAKVAHQEEVVKEILDLLTKKIWRN